MAKKTVVTIEKSVIEKIQQFTEKVKEAGIKVDKVILYGSYVSGNRRKFSDIDVAIISENFGKDRVEEGMQLFRISGEIDARIEPVPISSKSYKENTWIPLIYEIKTTGIEIM